MTETASKSDLSALLERVREAKGASLDLDLAIEQAVGPFPDRLVDNYTQSIDAALALVERVLPGASIKMGKFTHHKEAPAYAIVGVRQEHAAPTVPLAILAALLSALIAKESAALSKAGE